MSAWEKRWVKGRERVSDIGKKEREGRNGKRDTRGW